MDTARINIAKLFLISALIFALASCAPTSKDDFIGADELFHHWVNGDRYKIGGRKCAPSELPRLRLLADSARAAPSGGDRSVTVSDSDGTPYALGVGAPREFDRGRVYPLAVYLHGGVGTEANDKGARAYEMLGGLRDCLDVFLASPSANRFAPWWSPRGQGRILHAIRYMCAFYPIDTAKIFLAGVSDGATGCYAAASSIGGPFAGFFAVSGFGGMLPDLGAPLSIDKMKNRPIYNVQGGQDRLYPISSVNSFIDYLQKSGVPVTGKVYPGEGHGFDYRDREFPEFARLIREWSRPALADFDWGAVILDQNPACR